MISQKLTSFFCLTHRATKAHRFSLYWSSEKHPIHHFQSQVDRGRSREQTPVERGWLVLLHDVTPERNGAIFHDPGTCLCNWKRGSFRVWIPGNSRYFHRLWTLETGKFAILSLSQTHTALHQPTHGHILHEVQTNAHTAIRRRKRNVRTWNSEELAKLNLSANILFRAALSSLQFTSMPLRHDLNSHFLADVGVRQSKQLLAGVYRSSDVMEEMR